MRLPLIVAIAVLLAVGVLAGVVAIGSAADADPRPVEPIIVEAPAQPPAGPGAVAPEPALQPAPRDDDGYVVPPPPVDDDGDDDGPGGSDDDGDPDDDGPDDDGPDDDD